MEKRLAEIMRESFVVRSVLATKVFLHELRTDEAKQDGRVFSLFRFINFERKLTAFFSVLSLKLIFGCTLQK